MMPETAPSAAQHKPAPPKDRRSSRNHAARFACPRCFRLVPQLTELELLWLDGYSTVIACVAALQSSVDPFTVAHYVRTIAA